MKLFFQINQNKKFLFLVLLTSITHVKAQELSTGVSAFMSSTSFSAAQSEQPLERVAHVSFSPSLGVVFNLNELIFLQHNLALYDQVDEVAAYADYTYRYTFVAVSHNLCYHLNDAIYLGAGLPFNITTHASQSTNFGTIDLMEEGNVPQLLYGFSALMGHTTKLSAKSQLYVDLTRAQFLNSLDNDPHQQLTATSYVFSVKVTFNL